MNTHVVVVGNTPAAWISAVFLKRRLQIDVTIVVPPMSTQFTKVSASETFTPDLLEMHKLSGLHERQWAMPCRGSFQTAIRILGQKRNQKDLDAMLPFSEIGVSFDGIDFHHYAMKAQIIDFEAYSLASTMARDGKFVHPVIDNNSILSSFRHGVAVDVIKYISLMVSYAQHLGVEIVSVQNLKAFFKKDKVLGIELDNDQKIHADLYIDSTEELALWSQLKSDEKSTEEAIDSIKPLYNARLIAKSECSIEPPVYRTVENTPYGLFVSQVLADGIYYQVYYDANVHDPAQIQLYLNRRVASKDNDLVFKHEHLFHKAKNMPWCGNCVAISGSVGNFAPVLFGDLELSIRAVNRLIDIFPANNMMSVNAHEYNRLYRDNCARLSEYQEVFNYLIKAQSANLELNDIGIEEMQLTPNVAFKLRLFAEQGKLASFENDPIPTALWINLFLLSDHRPRTYQALLDMKDTNKIMTRINTIRDLVEQSAQQLPKMGQYLQKLHTKNRQT